MLSSTISASLRRRTTRVSPNARCGSRFTDRIWKPPSKPRSAGSSSIRTGSRRARSSPRFIFAKNKVDEAYIYLDGLIQTSELDDEELYLPLLGILAREQNADTVLAVTERIAEAYPERAYAQYLHAMLAAQSGRSEEALEYFDRSLELDEIEGVHATRAKVLLKMGRSSEAVISLRKAVERNPDDQSLRLTYAQGAGRRQGIRKGAGRIRKLHQASPDDAELLYTLGLLSLESQRLDDAEKYMMHADPAGSTRG